MNRAAPHPADRKELYKMKGFYRQKGAGTKKLFQAKKWIGYFKVTLEDGRGLAGRWPN